MALFTLSGFYFFAPFTLFFGFYLSLSYFISLGAEDFNYSRHRRLREYLDDIPNEYLPSVDVYLPICSEPSELILNTWKYVKELDYPNLKVYVLDDSKLDFYKAQANRFGFEYVRRDGNEMKKAGNLNHQQKRTDIKHGDYFLILDADFCPRPDMIKEMLGYFLTDKDTGIVQSPQFFRTSKDMNWIESGAGAVQELFYRLIQVNRNSFVNNNSAICTGTCAMYSREHVPTTALIGYSEDMHTGWELKLKGYRLEYIPVVLSCGSCPSDLASFFTQQYRWAMGSITLFFNPEFWKAKIKLRERLCYLSGQLYYVSTGLSLFIQPIPSITVLIFKPDAILLVNALFWLPSLYAGTLHLWGWMTLNGGLEINKGRIVSFYAHLFALKDHLMNSHMPWVATGSGVAKKVNKVSQFKKLMFWHQSIVAFVMYYLIGKAMNGSTDIRFYPIIAITAFNYYIAMSCFLEQD